MGSFLLSLMEEEIPKVINEFHRYVCGGHCIWRDTSLKILKVGFYWPKLFGEDHAYVRAYEKRHVFVDKQRLVLLRRENFKNLPKFICTINGRIPMIHSKNGR